MWARVAPIREAVDRLPFLTGLQDGTLPRETFAFYMAQDALYLAEYGRVLALCAAQAQDADELLFWSASATTTVQVERELHASHVTDLTEAEPSPTCTAYTSFLLGLAAGGCYPALAAGALPCFWIYEDVGTRLRDRAGDLDAHPYGDWIGTYGDPAFAESTRRARRIVDRLAARADAGTVARMEQAFVRSCQLEWMFWESASRRERWPVAPR